MNARQESLFLPRVVCWFSCGVTSAVAAKLALAKYGATHEVVVARIYLSSEHGDNDRFAADVERWLDRPILSLRSERYADVWEVWNERRFLVSPKGALCTTEMKKMVRHAFQRADDIQVFGFDVDEKDRAKEFRERNFDIRVATPLIDAGLGKADCLALIQRAGIEIPAMYRLGYHNNNCIGCVKGGMGYWNKIRVDFPEVFDRMAKLERNIGATCLRDKSGPVYLDELASTRGHYPSEIEVACSPLCETAMAEAVLTDFVRVRA